MKRTSEKRFGAVVVGSPSPDYLEDAKGNGAVNSGETDWNSASDLGLKVWVIRPKSNSSTT